MRGGNDRLSRNRNGIRDMSTLEGKEGRRKSARVQKAAPARCARPLSLPLSAARPLPIFPPFARERKRGRREARRLSRRSTNEHLGTRIAIYVARGAAPAARNTISAFMTSARVESNEPSRRCTVSVRPVSQPPDRKRRKAAAGIYI